MCRQRLAAGYFAERLTQQMGQLLHRFNLGAVLGNRREGSRMLDLLIGVTMPVHRRAVPRNGNDRGHAQVGILQAGGKVGGAHRLGEAETRFAGNPGVGIGHVSGRLLAMTDDALDAHIFHFHQGSADDGWNEENVGDTVFPEGFGEETRSRHPGHRLAS